MNSHVPMFAYSSYFCVKCVTIMCLCVAVVWNALGYMLSNIVLVVCKTILCKFLFNLAEIAVAFGAV